MLLLDEVGLPLHPLTSELNWPIGMKVEIDGTSFKIGSGLRWDIQWHLLDTVFYASSKRMSLAFKDSREAITILDSQSDSIRYLEQVHPAGASLCFIEQGILSPRDEAPYGSMAFSLLTKQAAFYRGRQAPSFLNGERPRK